MPKDPVLTTFPKKLTIKQRLEVILEARKLISKRQNWTRGHWKVKRQALTRNGNPKTVTCYCAQGAINEAAYRLGYLDVNPNDFQENTIALPSIKVNKHGVSVSFLGATTALTSFRDYIREKYNQSVTAFNDEWRQNNSDEQHHAMILSEFDKYAADLKRRAR